MFELLVPINYHTIILVIFNWYRIEYSRSYFHLEGSQGERIRVFKISRCPTQVTSYFGYFLSQSLLMLSFVSPTKSWSDLSKEMKSWKKKSHYQYVVFYAVASNKITCKPLLEMHQNAPECTQIFNFFQDQEPTPGTMQEKLANSCTHSRPGCFDCQQVVLSLLYDFLLFYIS